MSRSRVQVATSTSDAIDHVFAVVMIEVARRQKRTKKAFATCVRWALKKYNTNPRAMHAYVKRYHDALTAGPRPVPSAA